jgi:glucose/arabinose dehydrogenase
MGAALLCWLGVSACGSGGDSAKSVVNAPGPASITGSVSGTRIVAFNASDQILAEDDTAGKTPDALGHIPFQLSGLPIGEPVRVFFITGGRVYPLYIGNPETNAFSLTQAGPMNTGFVTTSTIPSEKATAENTPPPSSFSPGPPNPALPAAIAPTVTIASPAQNAALPAGPVTVSVSVQNFTIGGTGEPHVQFQLDDDPIPYDFLNGATNQVRYRGSPAANVEWQNTTGMSVTNLASGAHQIQFKLVDATGAELTNPQAMTLLLFSVAAPPNSPPTISVVSPSPGATFLPGPVPVSLTTANFSIGLQGQSHIHFFLDNDQTPYEFFSGPDEDTGVLYQGLHTHIVHWKTSTSFHMFQLASGTHQVRLQLVDNAHQPLGNPESTKTIAFTVAEPPGGELRLEPVLSGLNVPVSMALAPDGRVFYNELRTGDVRIVDIVGSTWQLRSTRFHHVDVGQDVDQGLLGIVLDPNFLTNHYVYIYYVTDDGTENRLIRLTEVNGQGIDPTDILVGLPANVIHNGGVLRFGPDGKLYVTIGEWNQPHLAQDLNSLGGKILRLNADGSAASNPFPSGDPRIYAMGLRSTFGMVFHPQTRDLWVTENGPDTDDEINRIVAGGNYGWPTVTGIVNDQRFLNPILAITPTIGPTGIVTIPQNSLLYPTAFHNNLLFAEVNGGKLRRIVLAGAQLDHLGSVSIAFNGGLGGLLDLIQGPDGYLYASGFSTIYRVLPYTNP